MVLGDPIVEGFDLFVDVCAITSGALAGQGKFELAGFFDNFIHL